MSNSSSSERSSLRRHATTIGLVAAGALAGGLLATTISASADTSPIGSAVSAATGGAFDGPGRSDENQVTGSRLATLKAAALDAVPGGTIVRVETDAGDGAYEAHMTKADGTPVTVKFDDELAVIEVQDGVGLGDPAPPAPNGSSE